MTSITPSPASPAAIEDPSTQSCLDFLQGGGEMGGLIRSRDWSATPLGPPQSWSPALRTMVRILLVNRFPLLLWWGPKYIQIYNDAYRPIPGAKHPMSLGQPASECWPEIWHVIGPLVDTPFNGGPATWSEDIELVINRAGFFEETHFTIAYSPVPDETVPGGIGGVLATVHEITEKIIGQRRVIVLRDLGAAAEAKSAEEACANVVAKLAKHTKDIPFALLYLTHTDGRHAALAATAGIEAAPGIAPPIVSLEESPANGAWPFEAAQRTGQMQLVENLSSKFPVVPQGPWADAPNSAIVLPIRSHVGHQFSGFLVAGLSSRLRLDEGYNNFLELVTSQIATAIATACAYEEERKRADALAEIDRAKTVFFSNVSHEFRTPLTLMLGPLENLLSKDALAPDDREEIATAHRNSLRLLKLVNSLLDFSRIEAGRIRAAFVPVDLAAVTSDLASNFRSAMEAAGLELKIDCKPLPHAVYVDRDMWEKIVLNLLSNAFKFTFEGSVTVRVEAIGDSAVLTIGDTGVGIPESELPHIFERFHRVEGTKGRSFEGTGIGLALIQELARLHGGRVCVESRLGEGSVFSVALPFGAAHLPKDRIGTEYASSPTVTLRAEAYTAEALTWIDEDQLAPVVPGRIASIEHAPPSQPHAPQSSSRARILVADDNADMRDHLRHILSSRYDLTTVADGRAALEAVHRVKPDLILSDVMMPGLDGFGLLAELRADTSTVNIPVIMLSARAGEESRVEGMEAGADDYLVKPFSARELVARVSAHLNLARLRREAKDQSARLLESITCGFLALDRDWRCTYVNAEAERICGIRREELLGRNHWEIFPQAVGTQLHQELTRVLEERVSADFENYIAPWDRWFHTKAFPAAAGGMTLFFDDITARKRTEAERDALAEHERITRDEAQILNEVSQALSGELDLKRLVQKVTDAATRLTGAEFGAFFQNVMHEPGESFVLSALSGVPPEDIESFGKAMRNTSVYRRTLRSGGGVIHGGDIVNGSVDSNVAPGERTTPGHFPVRSYLAIPVKLRSGAVLGGLFFARSEPRKFSEAAERLALGVANHAAIAIDNARLFQQAEREIAQRRKTEESLRRSEERFRGVFNSSAIGAAVLNLECRFLQANTAFCDIAGYSEDELKNLGCASLMYADDWSIMQAKLADLLAGKASAAAIENRYFRKDGATIWVRNTLSLMRDAEGRPENVIALCEDVTERKRADRASRLLSAIVDSSDDAIISKDLNGVITSWNQAAQRLFGFTSEDAVGQSVASLLIPEDRQDEETEILSRLRRGERVDHFETLRRCKDGRLLDISLTISPVRDARGVIIGASKIARDITYRKRTEQLDQEQTRLLEIIASGRPLKDCLVALTEAVDRLRPGTRAAVLIPSAGGGSAMAGVFGAQFPPSFADAQPGASLGDGDQPVACDGVVRADQWPDAWKKLWLATGIRATHATPILVGDRSLAYFVLCFSEARDPEPWELRIADFGAHAAGLTIERERVAAALRQSEKDFRELAEVGPQIIWLSGPHGELEFVNQRWIEFSGLNYEATKDPAQIARYLHPEDKVLKHWSRSVAAGTPFELEGRLRGKDGEFRWFMIRAVPIRDEQDRVIKWFGTSTDIHQSKMLELELRSANRDLEQFAYSVSHDLREPLRSVKLFSEMLATRYRERFEGEALEFLNYLRAGASRMDMLVRDLLAYTQATHTEIPNEPSDASAALKGALSNLARAIDETQAKIDFDALPPVRIHAIQLQQLFQNLIGNAVKYHRPGIPPLVRIRARRQNNYWLFSVTDNGIGIEAAYKDRIFGLFKRLHSGDEYSGSGIGLALCQRIVEQHHGRIWVESEPEKGSTFYFTLPV